MGTFEGGAGISPARGAREAGAGAGAGSSGGCGCGDGAPDELVVRGEYLSGRGIHDGDVVRVVPGSAHRARPGDLVAARAPDGGVAVGVLTRPPTGVGTEIGAWLLSDWDGETVRLCCCGEPALLGLAFKVGMVCARPGLGDYGRVLRARTERMSIPFLLAAAGCGILG